MKLSSFGKKITQESGILKLMEDLGNALDSKEKTYMLGGGNPAHIPQIQQIYRKNMHDILDDNQEYERLISNYDSPQGNTKFIDALAKFLQEEYNFPITPKNIAITNGSQSSFFILFNLIAGKMSDGSNKKILFPLVPEYIGYEDQGIAENMFTSRKPKFNIIDNHSFKYGIDFDNINITDDVSAICVSRPTNPTGNVVTDEEIEKLKELSKQHNIPLIIDNAYGAPFPNALFVDTNLSWDENTILSMSLSKCGLPSSRTGIIIANEEIIRSIGKANAVISLANGGFGQALMTPLLKDGKITKICNEIIKPFYLKKSQTAQNIIKKHFDDSLPYYLHKNEGSFFLWIWFKDFPINTYELYQKLKDKNVIILPSEYFFAGLEDKAWKHRTECIRINYGSCSEEDFDQAIQIIAQEVKQAYQA
ncbi:MAG: valine--pyruvate transaminase [Proteobacteria bacterium]|nr:valine--pyruvate transaminase [Pseudomonadota bacterium]